jgi:glycosyltransferase involved in cell wall biosynthesis
MLHNVKISVVIPVRNGEANLETCLTAVLDQTVPIYECIVVDNNSTDGTKKIIESFQKKHENVKYLLEKKPGRGSARNAGTYASTGDIIAMTDVDCIVPKDWLEKITAPIISGEETVVVGGEYDLISNYWSRHTQKMYDYLRNSNDFSNPYTPFIDTKNFAIRSPLLKAIPFDPRFKALEDEEIMFRMRSVARFRYLREVKVGHKHAQTILSIMKSAYSRSYWFAQIYHKYKGVPDTDGQLIFDQISLFWFYTRLPLIDFKALKKQGIRHLLYFIVYDFSWKAGTAVGYAVIDSALKKSIGMQNT